MAKHAIGGKSGSLMGGVGRSHIILLVAGIAFGRGTGKITCGMALAAILDVMSAR